MSGEFEEAERLDLGDLNDMGAVDAVLQVKGLNLVDAGCGGGDHSRELAARGAHVLAVEPDPIQAKKNRAAEPTANVTFKESHAEALPVERASVNGVFFFRSLHHVPVQHMDQALAEAVRVLAADGFLCVVEPAMTGSFFPMMRPFNDETEVRNAAQAALKRAAASHFKQAQGYRYMLHPRYDSFEDLVNRFAGRSFNSFSRESVEQDEVRNLFESGRTADGDYVFEQPMLLDLYYL